MIYNKLPTAEYLREAFDYFPETGILQWKWRSDVPLATNRRFAGKEAGSYTQGKLQVRINGLLYVVHRIVYVIFHGDCLEQWEELDHADLNETNNKINNLRKATHAQNNANKEKLPNNTSGLKGVELLPSGSWRACVAHIHIGCYQTKEEANMAYDKAAEALYGEYRRVTSLPK